MKRKNLVTALAGMALVSAVSAAALFSAENQKAAKAEDSATKPTVETVLLQDGASIRKSTENPGLRFNLFVNKTWYDTNKDNLTVGMYIAQTDTLTGDYNLTSDAGIAKIEADSINYLNVKMQPENVYKSATEDTANECYLFRVVLKMDSAYYLDDFTANGYFKLGETETVYNATPCSRSVFEVADKAYHAGETEDSVLAFVNNALNEDNFNAPAPIVTNKYKADEALKFALPAAECTVTWSNSNEAVASVDQKTGEITKLGVGETTITATIGTTTRSTTLTIEKPIAVDVSDNKGISGYNPNVRNLAYFDGWGYYGDFVAAGSESLSALTGDYSGDAMKIQAYQSSGYQLRNNFKESELNAMAQDYAYVRMWIAFVAEKEGQTVSIAASSAHLISNAFTFTEYGKWVKFDIPMSRYISLLSANDYTKCNFMNFVNPEGHTGILYVGDVEFVEWPETYTILDAGVNYDAWREGDYTSGGKSTLCTDELNFAGGYTGGVAKIFRHSLKPYFMTNPITSEELANVYKQHYNTVSIWVAQTADQEGDDKTFNTSGAGNTYFAYYVNPGAAVTVEWNTWTKLSISIEDYCRLLAANNYSAGIRLNKTSWHTAVVGDYLYIGNMFFENR